MPFPLTFTCPVILASESPRRRVLLEQIRLQFEVAVSPAEETVDDSPPPARLVRRLAARKATPVATTHPSALVLAADTVVAHQDDILEKPSSPAHARRMLRRLSDTTHQVHTGFALHHAASERQVAAVDTTTVAFAPLSDEEIDAYVDTGSPLDKAGGYGIQDHTAPLFVKHITGDYYTVVGLPLRALYERLLDDFPDLVSP
jgi:septum formation protein